MTPPAYIVQPKRRLQCTRCPRVLDVGCGCPVWVESEPGTWAMAQELAGDGVIRMHEEDTCAPEIPARCPSCKAPNWLEPRRYVRGEGTSKSTLHRRRAAKAAKRGSRVRG